MFPLTLTSLSVVSQSTNQSIQYS